MHTIAAVVLSVSEGNLIITTVRSSNYQFRSAMNELCEYYCASIVRVLVLTNTDLLLLPLLRPGGGGGAACRSRAARRRSRAAPARKNDYYLVLAPPRQDIDLVTNLELIHLLSVPVGGNNKTIK